MRAMHKPAKAGFLLVLGVVGMLGASAVGCGASTTLLYCDGASTIDSVTGMPVCCSEHPDHPDCTPCMGDCVELPPDLWVGPRLVWMGPEEDKPTFCPARAPQISNVVHADLLVEGACQKCDCAPSTGSCAPPQTIRAQAATCGMSGGAKTSFDGPPAWNGACTNANAVPADLDCGGVFCVQSIETSPLEVVENGCGVVASEVSSPQLPEPRWQTAAVACKGIQKDPHSSCYDPGKMCVPSTEPAPPEFKQCVFRGGDVDCPVSYSSYSEKHVFYEGFEDTRSCSDCGCGAPVGSECTATLSIFKDANCAGSPFEVYTIGSQGAKCHDVLTGSALMSKTLTNMQYTAGTCQATGGDLSGEVTLTGAVTYCCLPAEEEKGL